MEESYSDRYKSAPRLAGSIASRRLDGSCWIGSRDYSIRTCNNLASLFRSPTVGVMPVGAKQGEVSEVSRSKSHGDMNDLECLPQNFMFWLTESPS
jgi:hypothetical protein